MSDKTPPEKHSFEYYYDTIEKVVESKRRKWLLSSINFYDFQDAKSTIINHVFKKFNQFNPSKGSIEGWVSQIADNQLINIARGLYNSFRCPCVPCDASSSSNDSSCRIYGEKGPVCPLFKNWMQHKKDKHAINLAVSMCHHENEVHNQTHTTIDIEKSVNAIHIEMQKTLKPHEYIVYKMLYIEHKSEKEVAKKLGYKAIEKNKDAGYRSIHQIKKIIYEKTKKLLYEGEIDFIY